MTAPLVSMVPDGDVLVVTIDHPPVNALSQAVREGLLAAMDRLEGDDALRAMVLTSTGRVFIGGADIREFGSARLEPLLPAVCARLEASTKPVVAAMHGAALGGGFEVALAAHGRVASPLAVVAFPEVKLGLLPGAGGTQRAPRVGGVALALDLMLTGRHLPVAEALAAGLVDTLADDPRPAALAMARRLAAGATLPRSCDGRHFGDPDAVAAAFTAARAALPTQYAGLYSPARIIDCVEVATTQPFEAGCAYEARAFLDCLASPQRAVLVEQFFAERAARKAGGAAGAG